MNIVLKHGEVAVVDYADYELVSGYSWRTNSEGYAVSHRMVNGRVETVFMHRIINGTPDGSITDHIDQDRLNNRRSNLRTATKSLNSFNSKLHATNKSGYRGVSRVGRRWRSVITVNGKQEHLGYFDDPNSAGAAYERRLSEVAA